MAAVEKAGLVETLIGDEPFTVFAPTDEAFAKLPEGTIESLLNDIPALTRILTYHVVPGKYMASDVISLELLKSVECSSIPIKVEEGNVYVSSAMITTVDIEASNGVIHVIDTVILPPERETRRIPEIAIDAGSFTTLVTALQEAGLVEALMGDGPFTVFAPNDEAFAKLPEETIELLLKDIPTLTNILLYHVVSGEYMAEDVLGMRSLTALNGGQLMINPTEVKIQGFEISATDILAANRVIHVIDSVMIP